MSPIGAFLLGAAGSLIGLLLGLCLGAKIGYAKALQDNLRIEASYVQSHIPSR